VVTGERLGPFSGCLTPELLRAYAVATGDPNPGPRAGEAAPPAAVVTQIWAAQQAGFAALVPDEVRASMAGGVHGEHDVVLHRPIVPGEGLSTWVEGHGCRRGGNHALITLRYSTYAGTGELVAEQWWTTVLLNAAADPSGEPAPGHSFPEEARSHPAGEYRILPGDDMPKLYAEVSSDWSTHHFDDAEAQQAGFKRRFLHGLCTMALCAQGIVSVVAGGDPSRIRRLAVRFASPTYVGDELVVRMYRSAPDCYAFEAEAGGAAVIRHGLAELRHS
jgi:acyl dehydratase